MGFIYEYLKAVLWGAEEKSQTEENQGFGKDVEAWKEKEKECRKKLASELLEELKKKFKDTKTALKENNDSEKEKCEKKEKWGERWWCKSTAFIAYGVELTIAYVNHLLKLTPRLIVYSLTVAVAWISILVYWVARGITKAIVWISRCTFFLVHWPLRITFIPLTFTFICLYIAFLIYPTFGDLIERIARTDFIKKEVGDNKAEAVVAISSFATSALTLLIASLTQMVKDCFKNVWNGIKMSLSPPEIKIGEGLKQTKNILKGIKKSMMGLGLFLLIAAALLAVMVSSVTKLPAGDNNIYLYVGNTASVPVNCPDNKNSKFPLFTIPVLFLDEAKLEDWLDSKKNGKCEKDCTDSDGSQKAPDFDSRAVKPDKNFNEPIRTALKGLFACGSPEQKVELEIVGFSSSSGVLASLKDIRNNAEAEKELKKVEEGQKESCYERASGNGDQRLSNAFNLCIAELRAENVAEMLKKIIASDKTIPADQIKLVRPEWGSYSEMCQQRGFSDLRKEGECYDPDLGLMNRRVEIRAMALSGCISCCPTNGIHSCEAEAEMPPDSRGKTCGQSASPVVCSRNPDITNQP